MGVFIFYSHSKTKQKIPFNSFAGCTLLPSAFGESLGGELPKMKLGECNSLHSCRELSILACNMTRQPGETQDSLTHAHRPLKKLDLNEVRHERWGYTRGSKARRVFSSTLSLSPCLWFAQRECTGGTIFCRYVLEWHFSRFLQKTKKRSFWPEFCFFTFQ